MAIVAHGAGKAYTIRRADRRPTTLGEAIGVRLRRPFGAGARELFWALRDVDFSVPAGQVVGIVGRNGAGKSTLLKILSRITELTAGEVHLYGRVGSLLEVGTGFHQELTGRENVYLSGTILGMTRAEIARQFDEIVAFAGVQRFLDTPVKRYSSGMYVRLAFAVAAHLRSEILIIDEVLAVGDAEFQRKCLGKMKALSGDGRTVLFVSHSMHAVARLCDAALVLDAGRLSFHGGVGEAIDRYARQALETPRSAGDPARRQGSGEYRFVAVSPDRTVFAAREAKRVRFVIERAHGALGQFYPSAHLFDEHGLELAQMDGRLVGSLFEDAARIEGELVLAAPWLKPGRYWLDLYLCTPGGIVDAFTQACSFEVEAVLPYAHAAGPEAASGGIVLADFAWRAVGGADRPDERELALADADTP
jgi:lipopolysaccharide transport system ATP-binding protein